MKPATRRNILASIILLSVIGLLTSLYLIKSHYAPPAGGALCDFGENVSCSVVNTSFYSELFNVSVAVFGALWFVILLFMCRSALKNNRAASALMLGWSAIGMLFALYLIAAEFILKVICPFCTVVHVIILAILILSFVLYRAEGRKLKKEALLEAAKPWIGTILFINVIPVIVFNLPSSDTGNHDALAQCLTGNGVKMYGSVYCGHCRAQKKAFGESFRYIAEIECHPDGESPQTELCLERGIQHTPTWILEKGGEEVKRIVGYQKLETLAEFAGCPAEDEDG